jgi:2-iminobutanoate/2-iminopropanoate deaminase
MAAPHLSQLVDAGELVFTAGQLAFDENGQISGDIAAQTARTLQNLEAVLKTAGLGLQDVVKTTVWLTDVKNFAAYNDAYASAFGDHKPARSTVVSGLARPEALIEIEAVAKKR